VSRAADAGEGTARKRSSFGPTVAVGLGGAALATVAAGRPWAEATTSAQGTRTVAAAGTDVAAAALPLALVALAAWGAVLVLRRRGRRVVAVIGALAAVGSAVAVATEASRADELAAGMLGGASDVTVTTTLWPVVTVVGAVVAALTFAVALVRAPAWPEMSSRYDSPAESSQGERSMTDAELWRALDEGHDPTT
jgi:uncharacterized membrane protein (TIGR02234 family)